MSQGELFVDNPNKGSFGRPSDPAGIFELSVDAYYAALYARMSGLPIEEEISRFVEKVRKAGSVSSNVRASAGRAASDRGDPDVLVVLKAAGKVRHEIDRLTGLLRFKPDSNGVYTARCSPDYFILPALTEHFAKRFGETEWAIIDEKRNLRLYRDKSGQTRLVSISASFSLSAAKEGKEDSWEELWKLYHRSITNEAKKNLRLQRQFMPERYHKYLPEKT